MFAEAISEEVHIISKISDVFLKVSKNSEFHIEIAILMSTSEFLEQLHTSWNFLMLFYSIFIYGVLQMVELKLNVALDLIIARILWKHQ